MEEERKIQENQREEQESEDEKSKSGISITDEIDPTQRVNKLETQKRLNAEKQAIIQEREEKYKSYDVCEFRYRRYTIEEIEEATEFFNEVHKIGEGGYGPVFKCSLDHTTVAVKVLRPDATQGRSQFHQEVIIHIVLCSLRFISSVIWTYSFPFQDICKQPSKNFY